jgi:hypothetical protein
MAAELLFAGAFGVMAVGYTATGGSFVTRKPRVWSEARLSVLSYTYDLAPDGKRLAAIVEAVRTNGDELGSQLTFLLNFSDELRRRTPASK